MRLMFDAYAMWVPIALSLSLVGCGFMLGWMVREHRAGTK